ncbi:MAG: tyrosine-type recombinase/integrase, partial [Victivallales bacterium]|nr:tyrosine-type recombinase/integrase [Victivallales bacterium]
RIKPKWVYLTENQIKTLCDNAKLEYRALIVFLYDTGIRSPGELINIKVSDLHQDFKELNIRDDIVKRGSFGRRIKLMFSSDLIKSHISLNGLSKDSQLFNISPSAVNQYLKRLAKRVLGDGISLAGEKYSNLTMYDFRHCSCCYWLPRYKSESALKYRFGWKKSDKIHYYSELLGMKDTIQEEDMLIDLTKTEIERRLIQLEKENYILKDTVMGYKKDISTLKALMQIYIDKQKQLESTAKK